MTAAISIAAQKRRLYAKRKAAGLAHKTIWARREDWPALLEVIDEFKMRRAEERAGQQQSP